MPYALKTSRGWFTGYNHENDVVLKTKVDDARRFGSYDKAWGEVKFLGEKKNLSFDIYEVYRGSSKVTLTSQ